MSNLVLKRRPSSLLPILHEAQDPFSSPMNLLSWDPFKDLVGWDPLRNSRGLLSNTTRDFLPAVEVKETPTAFEFKADVPGIKEQDLDVSLSGNRLCISGKREAEHMEEGDTYHTYERTFGSFNRTFNLPDDVSAEKIKADVKDGVLHVVVPKVPEARPKKIEIKTK